MRPRDPLVHQHIAHPSPMLHQVERARRRHRPGRLHMPAPLALAIAEGRHIDRHEQRGIARRLGALDQLGDPLGRAERIELEPVILVGRLGDFLDLVATRAAEAKPGPRLLGRARHRDIGTPVAEARSPRGRAGDRHRDFRARNAGAQIGVGDTGKLHRAQPPALERRDILVDRQQIVGAALEIAERHAGQLAARDLTPFLDVHGRHARLEPEPHHGIIPPRRISLSPRDLPPARTARKL